MKTNPLTSKLNNLRQALRLRQTFRLLRQALCRLLCAQPNSPASPERRGGGQGAGWYTRLQAAEGIKEVRSPGRTKERKGAGGALGTQPQRDKEKFAKYLIPTAILLLFFLLISLVACKSPATLTNDTQHRTRDSNYHATVHRIETHDTIIIGPYPKTLPAPPLKGGNPKSPFKGDLEGRGDLEGQVLLRISDRKITIHDTIYVCRTDTLLRTQTITQPQKYIPPFYRFCTITLITLITLVTLAFYIRLLLRYLKIRSPT